MANRSAGYKITLGSCVVFAVGTMIGGGVFVLSGPTLDSTGPAALVSYALAACLMLFSALSFGVIASRAPATKSGYYYVGEALGPLWRFIVQWAFYVNGIINVAFVLQSFGEYTSQYFIRGVSALIIALLALLVLTLLNFGPADKVSRAEWVLVSIKMAALALLIVVGLLHLGNAHFVPFAPHGATSVFKSAATLFIAYLGFNVILNMASSVDQPQRTIPRAIIISMALVAVFYIGVILAMLASNLPQYGNTGLGMAAAALMGTFGAILIPFAACLSTLSSGNANIIGCSELMIRLSANGDVPTIFGRMSRGGHPIASVLLVALIAVVLMLTGKIGEIVNLSNVTALVAMIIINLSAIYANRKTRAKGQGEDEDEGVKGLYLPGGPLIPVLGIISCVIQLPFLGWVANLIGIALIVAGLILYLSRRKAIQPHHQARLNQHIAELNTPAQRSVRSRQRS